MINDTLSRTLFSPLSLNVGALKIRIGFGGIYYQYIKEPPKPPILIIKAPTVVPYHLPGLTGHWHFSDGSARISADMALAGKSVETS